MSSVIIAGNTSGTITLDAPPVAGSNTITLPASTGIAVVTPTGTVAGGQIQTQLFTSSGTWTAPATVTTARITVIGGGGGGSTSSAPIGGGGVAGTGGLAIAQVSGLSGSYTVTIGAGGAGAPAGNGVSGASGGTSSFGALVSATGGSTAPTGPATTVGTPGSGTVTSGTNIKTSSIYQNQPNPASSFTGTIASFGLFGLSNPNASTTAIAYSESGTFGAGQRGNSNFNPGNSGGGIGGAVLVEFVG
jgi:hypothetical protein